MHHGSWPLRLGSIVLLAAEAMAARQQPKDLPEAPAPKQEPAHKHDSTLQATFQIMGRRSVFFPDLAASPGPLSSKQKLELFAGKSLAPSRFLSSALARNSSLLGRRRYWGDSVSELFGFGLEALDL